ncbi:MAG: hypothetical protein JWP91_2946 [Fibrobacteres bacterium]|nr:hypothetical protein [Fibrobacterota bacterium]
MVLKHASIALAALIAGGSNPTSAQTLRERMDDTYERVLSKHGVDVGGRVNSEYFHSDLSGSAKADTNYAFETTQFTSFDLDMQYRAFDNITAQASLRFYQDWQTFFATRSRILAARWLSVDGNIARTLGFNAGDFRQKYSELTLWSPELDLVYEPMIFSRMRRDLMEEQHIADNDRILQGGNLNFARRFDGALSELRLDAFGSRIRRGEFLDPDGYQGFHLAKSDMDRFAFGANGEAFLAKNVFLGGSYLAILDDRDSYRQTAHNAAYIQGLVDVGAPPPAGWSLNDRDSVVARDIRVVSGRAGADVAGFLGNPDLTLNLTAEYALSQEANRFAWHFKKDAAGKDVSFESNAPGKDGKALFAELEAGYAGRDSGFGVNIALGYLNNEAAFLNPLAQSPTFIAARIMNTENDYADGRLYSTFDALNNGVYKFSASQKVVGANESYHQAPLSKTSYNNGILSPEDLSAYHGDPVLQLVLPNGNATPNRTGPKARLTGHWAGSLHATVDIAMLKELEGGIVDGTVAPLATFTQMGGGLLVEAGKMMGRPQALDFQASFVRSASKRDRVSKDLTEPEITADLLMAGFRWQFFTKWGLLGGYQQAKVASPMRLSEIGGADAKAHSYQYTLDETQKHFRAGVEYAVTRDAYLLLSGGLVSVDRTRINQGTAENAEGPIAARNVSSDFTQTLSQVVIKVRF